MGKKQLSLYTINMKYVRDLHKVDDKVQSVSPQIHKSNRPFVGVVMIVENKQYCIPLDSPKEKHLGMKNDIDFSKIIVEGKLLGVLNINNMIPVDSDLITKIDLRPNQSDGPKEVFYKNQGIATWAECENFPCKSMKECFEVTASFEHGCRQACTEDEYEMLKKAFFEKEENLNGLR